MTLSLQHQTEAGGITSHLHTGERLPGEVSLVGTFQVGSPAAARSHEGWGRCVREITVASDPPRNLEDGAQESVGVRGGHYTEGVGSLH